MESTTALAFPEWAGYPEAVKRMGARDVVAMVVAIGLLGTTLWIAFAAMDEWAARSFARPILASALLAVCELALFLVAICVAPALSRVLRLLLGQLERKRGG